MSFDIYMKWKLDYSIFVLDIRFFLDRLELQINQENIHSTFTVLKVLLALKLNIRSKNSNIKSEKVRLNAECLENLAVSSKLSKYLSQN